MNAIRMVRSAGMALSLFAALGCGEAPVRPSVRPSGRPSVRPNVLLITLDTTRADHLSCYGYERETSPHLDELARESVVYTRAISTSSWTLPAHASLFTGKFTTSHGARYDEQGPLSLNDGIDGNWGHYRARGLAEDETTLAMLLKEAGYATGAVVAGPWMKAVFGLDAGFDNYDDDGIDSLVGRLAPDVTEAALGWLDRRGEEPFFLFVNYYDAHAPYLAPEPFRYAFVDDPEALDVKDSSQWPLLYDGEIRFADESMGHLFAELRARGLWENTLVVVTSDHGELLGDHGGLWSHGKTLFQVELHVPLVVRYPGGRVAPRQVDEPIQPIDLFALILDHLGIEPPPDTQGGLPPEVGHPIVSEVYPLAVNSRITDWRVVFDGDEKLWWSKGGESLLFDIAMDPHELRNLAPQEAERVAHLSDLLNAYLGSLPTPGAAPERVLDPSTMRALEGLGYVK